MYTRRNESTEYIIFCDESEKNGEYFSNFYGGALLRFKDLEIINRSLKSLINEMDLNEIKRSKCSLQYVERYKKVLNLFFDYVEQGKIKVRVICSDTKKLTQTKENKRTRYSKFYFLFLKHAFGLSYLPQTNNNLRLYFDQLPTNKADTFEFKRHIKNLQYGKKLKNKIRIRDENIVDVNSKEHPIIQCVDLITGVLEFFANKHEWQNSNRGMAKIEIYNLIHNRVEKNRSAIFSTFRGF